MPQHSDQRNLESPWKRYGHPDNCYSKAAMKRHASYIYASQVERSTQEVSSTPGQPQDPRIARREALSLCRQQDTDPATRYAGTLERNVRLTEIALSQLPMHGTGSAIDTCCNKAVEDEGASDGSKVDAILQQVKNMCADVEDRSRQKYEAMLTAKDAEHAAKSREWAQQRSELLANDEYKKRKMEQYLKEVSHLQTRLERAERKCSELTSEVSNAAMKQFTVISTIQCEYEKMLKEYNANIAKERDRMQQYVEYLQKKRQDSDEEWANSAKALQRTKLAFEEASKKWNTEKAALEHRIGTLRSNEQIYFETNEALRKRNSKLDEANARLNVTVGKLLALADASVDEELKKKAVATVSASLQMFTDTSQPGMTTKTTVLRD